MRKCIVRFVNGAEEVITRPDCAISGVLKVMKRLSPSQRMTFRALTVGTVAPAGTAFEQVTCIYHGETKNCMQVFEEML